MLHVAEISEALEYLRLNPSKRHEQAQLFRFLNELNEWGFTPLTLEFEAFLRFVRLVREWRQCSKSDEDAAFAEQQLGYSVRQVRVYQAIFEIIDKQGEGTLDMGGLRRAVRLLKRTHITSDELRDLFARTDEDSNGSVSFSEFIRMVSEMEPPTRETWGAVSGRATPQDATEDFLAARDHVSWATPDLQSEPIPAV